MTFTPEQLAEQTRLADEQGPNPSISGNYTLTHAKELYKSLSTVGEFFAYIWFREEEYDENRSEGERDVIIYGTPELMEVVDDLNRKKNSAMGRLTKAKSEAIVMVSAEMNAWQEASKAK